MVLLNDLFHNIQIDEVVTFFILLVLLVFSGLISGSETAFFSLDPSHKEDLKARGKRAREKVGRLLDKPKHLLATILIANNFINVGIVIIATYLSNLFFDKNANPVNVFMIQIILITSVILLFGEIIPKILANKEPVPVAVMMSGPLSFLNRVFMPISSLLVSSTSFIDNRIGDKGHNITMSDLSDAIEMTIDENASEGEKMILKGIASFGDKEASEIMKSRLDITALNVDTDFDSMMRMAIESGYSRIPVYSESIDNILGVFYVKDLLPNINNEHTDNDWVDLIRPVFYVPENKKINDLLQDFRKRKIHLAIVVDEYGGTSGIITLEDIIEEIVGDISDEFDEDDESDYKKLGENRYKFLAKTPINDFCKIIKVDDETFDNIKGESDSLGGLLLEINGNIPGKGSIINYENFSFKVIDVDKRRLKEIEITINADKKNDK
ncbi:MAG: gliding motility-associated protein GldE [Chlorobi bacterium]|nr:gliding motility-associated protein GldE [Chlorobiota bacterium]